LIARITSLLSPIYTGEINQRAARRKTWRMNKAVAEKKEEEGGEEKEEGE